MKILKKEVKKVIIHCLIWQEYLYLRINIDYKFKSTLYIFNNIIEIWFKKL